MSKKDVKTPSPTESVVEGLFDTVRDLGSEINRLSDAMQKIGDERLKVKKEYELKRAAWELEEKRFKTLLGQLHANIVVQDNLRTECRNKLIKANEHINALQRLSA